MRPISAATLRGWIQDGHELAILDAREEGEFGRAHLFWSVNVPLSRAELLLPALLPNPRTRVVCVDDETGPAHRLALLVERMGGSDVSVLEGGTRAWAECGAAAGYVLFSGVNVPSKAFGEWVEHHYGTESVDAPELDAWMRSGRKMVVLDSRPMEEFRAMSIPSGIDVPGGELVYRIGDLAPDPETLVVVNCAGRTRSILGAESLRRARIPNRVVALRNGTMGWQLAGFQAARGESATYPSGRPASADLALQRAEAFAAEAGVRRIESATLAGFAADETRTLHLLDVRAPDEFAAGHAPGTLSAPGGQLVQATDRWIAVRGARLVLVDDDGVRAAMTGAWLRLMGHRDVYTIRMADLPSLPRLRIPVLPLVESVAPQQIGPGTPILDVSRSLAFRAGHVPGSLWGVRTRLAPVCARLAGAAEVVVTSEDGRLAALAAAEVAALSGARVRVMAGGMAAWRDAGLALAADRTTPPDEACVDVYLRPYDRNSGVEAAMREYLSWEVDLVREIERDGTVRFGV
ncbi:MAG: thiosulfate sulfurtransferase [Rhodospirillales bacterium]|nr:thiosulfate sulfurtransferase [Rhodospirillales bacterium]